MALNILKAEDYKRFVNEWVGSRPGQGRGEFQKIARYLAIHPTLVSQIFRGERHLTPEQAGKIVQYLGLDETESEYFLLLVLYERAGNEELKNILSGQIDSVRERALKLVNRLSNRKVLSEQDQARFYSCWTYSAVRLLIGIEGYQTSQDIARRLQLSLEEALRILEFLEKRKLCEKVGEGYQSGKIQTHLPPSSPFIWNHHTNWRLKTLQDKPGSEDKNLVFTGPMTISIEDADKIREMAIQLIKATSEVVENSPPETLAYLNLDWVHIS